MKKSFSDASELDGYEDLKPEDQEKVNKAWEEGHVADEDIPESARKADDGEDDGGEGAGEGVAVAEPDGTQSMQLFVGVVSECQSKDQT